MPNYNGGGTELLLRRKLLNKGSETVKEWKKVKVFEDLTQESSVTFSEPYTELMIISENVKAEDNSQLYIYLNGQAVSGQNGDLKMTGCNCVDFIECIADGFIKRNHMMKQGYAISTVSAVSSGIFNIGTSEISSLRLAPQYGSFSGGKATVYAR